MSLAHLAAWSLNQKPTSGLEVEEQSMVCRTQTCAALRLKELALLWEEGRLEWDELGRLATEVEEYLQEKMDLLSSLVCAGASQEMGFQLIASLGALLEAAQCVGLEDLDSTLAKIEAAEQEIRWATEWVN